MNAGIFLSFLNGFYTGNDFFHTQNATIKKARPTANYLNKQQSNKQKKN